MSTFKQAQQAWEATWVDGPPDDSRREAAREKAVEQLTEQVIDDLYETRVADVCYELASRWRKMDQRQRQETEKLEPLFTDTVGEIAALIADIDIDD